MSLPLARLYEDKETKSTLCFPIHTYARLQVRNLKNMGFRIPFTILSGAHAAATTYPFAISLLESVRVYDATNDVVFTRGKSVEALVANYRRVIHEALAEGYNNVWDSYRIETYVCRVADVVNTYQEKVGELIEILDRIDVEMAALDTCAYKHAVVGELLASVQKSVDQLVLNNYSNLKAWIAGLNRQVTSGWRLIFRAYSSNVRLFTARSQIGASRRGGDSHLDARAWRQT